MTDEKLQHIIRGCQRNERISQEAMYRAFYAYGITIALHYAEDMDTAKAIYNDAMFKAFRNMHQYSGQAPLKSWLRRIIINSAIDYNRRYYEDKLVDLDSAIIPASTKPLAELNLAMDDLLRIINQIPVSYRTVFLLHSVEGFKFIEIAEQLKITEGGAKSLYNKAKGRIQQLMIKYFEINQ